MVPGPLEPLPVRGLAHVVGALAPAGPLDDTLSIRLQWLCAAVAARFRHSLCVLQAWLAVRSPGAAEQDQHDEFSLCAERFAAVVCDPSFQQFRALSLGRLVQFKSSMTGRTWKSGATQVVQNLRLVPPTMHPRTYLQDADLDKLGEALYIPVYDQLRPGGGPVTVLEALLPASSPEPVISADLLSFISVTLLQLRLSISNPMPQPVQRSALCGRRARADMDSAPDMDPKPSPHASSMPPMAEHGNCSDPPPPSAPAVKALSSPPAVGQPGTEPAGAACPTTMPAVAALTSPGVLGGATPVDAVKAGAAQPAASGTVTRSTASTGTYPCPAPARSTARSRTPGNAAAASSDAAAAGAAAVASAWGEEAGDATPTAPQRASKRARYGMVRSKSMYYVRDGVGASGGCRAADSEAAGGGESDSA